MGATLGAAYRDVVQNYLDTLILPFPQGLEIAGTPAFAMVGAASVLSALFKAPLTGSILLFELTRDYEIIVPLMASAGLGSLVIEVIDDRLQIMNN